MVESKEIPLSLTISIGNALMGDDDEWERSISSSFVPQLLRRLIEKSLNDPVIHPLSPVFPRSPRTGAVGHRTRSRNQNQLQPSSMFLDGYCLLVDISGFTKLSGQYCSDGKDGIDALQQATNGFMSEMVNIIYFFGGDIMKYAGDAIICFFPLVSSGSETPTPELTPTEGRATVDGRPTAASAKSVSHSTEFAVSMKAIQCAQKIKSMVSDQKLTVHVGLSAGELCFGMIGGAQDQWECLISGSCMGELSQCLDDAPSGCAVLSKSVVKFLGDAMVTEWLSLQNLESGNFLLQEVKAPVATGAPKDSTTMNTTNLSAAFAAAGMVTNSSDTELQTIQSCLVRFCPAPVMYGVQQQNLERIAQIRTVTVVFMKWDSYDVVMHRDIVSLQRHFYTCQEFIHAAGGFIRQFIVDDKGCVLIACWGVPSSSFIDNAHRALSSVVKIHESLNADGMRCSFGITTGEAYCGCVGSVRRREYAAIGDVVNLSARLMGKSKGRIFIDSNTFNAISGAIKIDLVKLDPITVKGKSEPIEVYVYQTSTGKRSQGKPKLESLISLMLPKAKRDVIHRALAMFLAQGDSTRKAIIARRSHGRYMGTEDDENQSSSSAYDSNSASDRTGKLHTQYMLVDGRDGSNKVVLDFLQHQVGRHTNCASVHVTVQDRDIFLQLKLISRLFSAMIAELMIEEDEQNISKTISRVVRGTFRDSAPKQGYAVMILKRVLGIVYENPDTQNTSESMEDMQSVSSKALWICVSKLFEYILRCKSWLVCIENIDIADKLSLFYLYTFRDFETTSLIVLSSAAGADTEVVATVKAPSTITFESPPGSDTASRWSSWKKAKRHFMNKNEFCARAEGKKEGDDLSYVSNASDDSGMSKLSEEGSAELSSSSITSKQPEVSKKVWSQQFRFTFLAIPATVEIVVEDMDVYSIKDAVLHQVEDAEDALKDEFCDVALQITNGDPFWLAELLSFVKSVGLPQFMETIYVVERSAHFRNSIANESEGNSPVRKTPNKSPVHDNNSEEGNEAAAAAAAAGGGGGDTGGIRKRTTRRSITLQSFKTREVSKYVRDASVLEAFVVCRYEALSSEEKTVIRHVSVMGYRFSVTVCREIIPDAIKGDFMSLLSDLESHRWVSKVAYNFKSNNNNNNNNNNIEDVDEQWYRFCHPLFQQVVFNFTPNSERIQLHSMIADCLIGSKEESFEYYTDIFQHLKSCGRNESAVDYAYKAGCMSLNSPDTAEGVDYCYQIIKKSFKLCESTKNIDLLISLANEALVALSVSQSVKYSAEFLRGEDNDDEEEENEGSVGEENGAVVGDATPLLLKGGKALVVGQQQQNRNSVSVHTIEQGIKRDDVRAVDSALAAASTHDDGPPRAGPIVRNAKKSFFSIFACCGVNHAIFPDHQVRDASPHIITGRGGSSHKSNQSDTLNISDVESNDRSRVLLANSFVNSAAFNLEIRLKELIREMRMKRYDIAASEELTTKRPHEVK